MLIFKKGGENVAKAKPRTASKRAVSKIEKELAWESDRESLQSNVGGKLKRELSDDDLYIAKKEYERGKSFAWIEDKYKFSRFTLAQACRDHEWKGRAELKRELFNTSIEIPEGLELPSNHQVLLQNLTITDRFLNMLLMLVDEVEFDCLKLVQGYDMEQVNRTVAGNVKSIETIPAEINPRKYGFKSIGDLGETIMRVLDKRWTYMKELPDLVKTQDLQSDIERVAKKLQMGQLEAFQRNAVPEEGVVYMERTIEEEMEIRRMQKEIEAKSDALQQTTSGGRLSDKPRLRVV
jgi:hypothetical protein